jgi:hypothetical protein
MPTGLDLGALLAACLESQLLTLCINLLITGAWPPPSSAACVWLQRHAAIEWQETMAMRAGWHDRERQQSGRIAAGHDGAIAATVA